MILHQNRLQKVDARAEDVFHPFNFDNHSVLHIISRYGRKLNRSRCYMNFHYRTRQSNHGADDDLAKFYLGQVPIIRRPGLLSLASFDVTLTFCHVLAITLIVVPGVLTFIISFDNFLRTRA